MNPELRFGEMEERFLKRKFLASEEPNLCFREVSNPEFGFGMLVDVEFIAHG